jgi:hypothetical protein
VQLSVNQINPVVDPMNTRMHFDQSHWPISAICRGNTRSSFWGRLQCPQRNELHLFSAATSDFLCEKHAENDAIVISIQRD